MTDPTDWLKKLREQERALSPWPGIQEALRMSTRQVSPVLPTWASSPEFSGLASMLKWREQLPASLAPSLQPDFSGLAAMVARVGLTPVQMFSPQAVLRDQLRVVRPDMLLEGRLAWASGITPLFKEFQRQQERFLLAQEELDRDLERDARIVMDHFEQEGWHLFPLLWVEDLLLPKLLRRKLEEGPEHAKAEVLERMVSNGEALKEYMRERALNLNLPDEERDRRLGAVFKQFDQVCRGEAEESAASVMISQAEGFFNAVAGPLGLEKGAFYTNDKDRIQRRKEVLDGLHAQIPQGGEYLSPVFDRRRYKRFTRARAKSIPVRDALQHGGGLEYWTQEHAFWATTFLMLTLEYLEALCLSRDPVQT